MNALQKVVVIFIALLAFSLILMFSIHVGSDSIGMAIAKSWCSTIGINASTYTCLDMLNSYRYSMAQGLALALFLFVIALTALKMEWRLGAAILALIALILTGIAVPQEIISAVRWDLILFLVGSMTLAGILRALGVFRFIAIKMLKITKGNAVALIALLATLAYALAATLDEVTSIVYVTMLALELGRILGVSITPLLILLVLATNTGSSALPIGNPIGIYLLYKTNMSISEFIRTSFPASLVNLVALLMVFVVVEKGLIKSLMDSLSKRGKRVEAFITRYEIELQSEVDKVARIRIGLIIFLLFVFTIALNDFIVHGLSRLFNEYIDPHEFLSFIPYIYIVILSAVIGLEKVARFIEKSVEWSSLLFFVMLFMLSDRLTYTGVIAKLTYVLALISSSPIAIIALMLISSAALSAVLDNLSVIVTFTPIAMTFKNVGLASSLVYFALLFGGVYGGNYTPIGSTANIVAVGLAEKHKIKITWGEWLKLALVATTIQIVVSLLYLYIMQLFV
jgi:Na+/H+ antiporter NhaD/arsenite permease-like protein